MSDPTAYCPGCGATRCTCAADEAEDLIGFRYHSATEIEAIADHIDDSDPDIAKALRLAAATLRERAKP